MDESRVLLEQAGEVVTREELQKRLWPDTFVDVDHNLNTAINTIREVLGDSAESPRHVETLPRRGYRFIGEMEPPIEAVAPVEPDVGHTFVAGGGLRWALSPSRSWPLEPSLPIDRSDHSFRRRRRH
jgi:hypothetical protein